MLEIEDKKEFKKETVQKLRDVFYDINEENEKHEAMFQEMSDLGMLPINHLKIEGKVSFD